MIFAARLILLAAAVSAAPALKARQFIPGPQCNGLGPAVFDVVNNFTLAAFNTSLPNANDTGVPLVLGQAGAIDGAEFKVFSVRASPVQFSHLSRSDHVFCRPTRRTHITISLPCLSYTAASGVTVPLASPKHRAAHQRPAASRRSSSLRRVPPPIRFTVVSYVLFPLVVLLLSRHSCRDICRQVRARRMARTPCLPSTGPRPTFGSARPARIRTHRSTSSISRLRTTTAHISTINATTSRCTSSKINNGERIVL